MDNILRLGDSFILSYVTFEKTNQSIIMELINIYGQLANTLNRGKKQSGSWNVFSYI